MDKFTKELGQLKDRLLQLENKHKNLSHNVRNGMMVLKQMLKSDQELVKGMEKRCTQIEEALENNNGA